MPQPYYTLDKLLEIIPEPNRTPCQNILEDIRKDPVLSKAPGSIYNHQTWPGGYLDHARETMNIAMWLYMCSPRLLPFKLSDALLVLFLHDLEKPWRFLVTSIPSCGNILRTKEERKKFRRDKIQAYGITLTPEQENALLYVEGEGDDYSPKKRVMNELAGFCHICDVFSARVFHDYPLAENDSWKGACRSNSTEG